MARDGSLIPKSKKKLFTHNTNEKVALRNVNYLKPNTMENALMVIDESIKGFVMQICRDTKEDKDNNLYVNTNIDVFSNVYIITLFHKGNNAKLHKRYDLMKFLRLCQSKKIESVMNKDVKELLSKIENAEYKGKSSIIF